MGKILTILATIGPVGYIPTAPGTFGSVVGLGLGFWLLSVFNLPIAFAIVVVMLLASVAICSKAELSLGEHDPHSIVLDEVCGMSLIVVSCPWVTRSWQWLLVSFLVFRFFDILKVPPARQLESIPGGLGIVADDVGAAVLSIIALWGIHLIV